MKAEKPVQIIEKDGKPEWAVIPYKDFLRYREIINISKEVKAFKKNLKAGKEELLPSEYVERLVLGESPIRVWREFRGLTQASLAKELEISTPYLSQIENADRQPSMQVLKKIAKALMVSLDDIV